MGLKAFEPNRDTTEIYLPKLLMSYRLIPHAGIVQNPSALMGRQKWTPITVSFSTNEKTWYRKAKKLIQEANSIMPKGNNTPWSIRGGNWNVLAYADQIRNRFEDVCMEELNNGLNLPEGDQLEENVTKSNTQ